MADERTVDAAWPVLNANGTWRLNSQFGATP